MAKIGRGAVAYVGPDEGSGEKVDQFYERACRPAWAHIRVDWGALQVTEVYPKKIPDLFVGRPVMIVGRFKGSAPSSIRITGRVGGEEQSLSVPVDPASSRILHPAVRTLWARWKIADLSDQEIHAPSEDLRKEITAASIAYGLLSRYTAFLAVDSSNRTKGNHGYGVHVPVPVPDGVRYDTTVTE
jgi:Ca-activated chloride channel family protein